MQTSEAGHEPASLRRELLARIERVLDDQVRPGLRSEGGDIIVVGIDEDHVVQVRLTGACQGCPSAIVTLSMRVESTLKTVVPEVRFVEAVP
jgi:Fe-S cluster biogenesis protein NfuA